MKENRCTVKTEWDIVLTGLCIHSVFLVFYGKICYYFLYYSALVSEKEWRNEKSEICEEGMEEICCCFF